MEKKKNKKILFFFQFKFEEEWSDVLVNEYFFCKKKILSPLVHLRYKMKKIERKSVAYPSPTHFRADEIFSCK